MRIATTIITLAFLCCPALLFPQSAENAKTAAPYYDKLLEGLLRIYPQAKDESPIKTAIGDFPCGNPDHHGISAVSASIRQKLGEAAAKNKRIKLITRERLGELIAEKKLQSTNIIDPQSVSEIKVDGIEAIIRGYYYYEFPKITVRAEMLRLSDGAVFPFACEMPVSLAGSSEILPDSGIGKVERTHIYPQNTQESKSNRESVDEISARLPNKNIKIQIWTASGRTDFANGEEVKFRVRASQDCFIALIAHFIDASSMLIYPNKYCADSFVPADQIVEIPSNKQGEKKFYFEISPPFGGDIVQVLAASTRKTLNEIIGEKFPVKQGPFSFIARENFGTSPKIENDSAFGEASIIINAYPR
jgi:hypothetical protein